MLIVHPNIDTARIISIRCPVSRARDIIAVGGLDLKDELFKEPLSRATDFTFNRDVAAVFDDMVHRSIPFYGEVQNMIVDLVAHYYQDETLVYDLGCSTGVLIAKLAAALPGLKGIVGLDNGWKMKFIRPRQICDKVIICYYMSLVIL